MDVIQKTLLLGSKVSQAIKNDGWSNIFTGMGVAGKDKRTGNSISRKVMPQRAAELLHDNDDLAKLAVNEVPDRGTAKWIDRKVGQEEGGIDVANDLVKEDKRLLVKKKFKKAWAWARLYGGSGVYVSVDDGLDPNEPLNLNRIVRVNSLTVLHRWELQRNELNDDINSPNFGLPETYTISGRTSSDMQEIHHTRIIRFDGAPLSEQEFKNNDYWNDSVLTVLQDILRDYNGAYAGVSHAMHDFDVSILKLKDLADIVGSDDDDLITRRLKLMNLAKSVLGTIIIDADDEDFETMSRQFTNVDKVLEKMDQRLVMAMRMPHTVVLGQGSTGSLGAGGESESNNMNALVSAQQEEILDGPLDYLDEIIQAAKQGPTSGNILKTHARTFKPLSEPGEKEVAETRKLVAEGDKIYLENQVLSAQEVADSRFGGDEYSIETALNGKARVEQNEADKVNEKDTKKIMKGIE